MTVSPLRHPLTVIGIARLNVLNEQRCDRAQALWQVAERGDQLSDRTRLWIPELGLGLGLWQVAFEGVTRYLLRWYDNQENWLPTDAERAMQAETQLRQVALKLLQQGMTLEQVSQLTGLPLEQVQRMVGD